MRTAASGRRHQRPLRGQVGRRSDQGRRHAAGGSRRDGTAASGRRRQRPAARSGRRAFGSRSTARRRRLPPRWDRRLRTPAPAARCAVRSAGVQIKVDRHAARGSGRDGTAASGRRRQRPAARSGRRASRSRLIGTPPAAPAAMGPPPPDAGASGPLRGRVGGRSDQGRRDAAGGSGRDGTAASGRRHQRPLRGQVGGRSDQGRRDAAGGSGRDGIAASGRRHQRPLRGQVGGRPDEGRRHGAGGSGPRWDRRLQTPAPAARCAVGRIKVERCFETWRRTLQD